MNSLVAVLLVASLVVISVEAQQECGRRTCNENQCCIRNRVCRPLRREGEVCHIEGRELRVCPCSAGLQCTGDNVKRCTSSEGTENPMTSIGTDVTEE